MKRKMKLIMNIGIVVSLIIILIGSDYYFYGSYFTKEECVEDSARGLYLPEGNIEYCLKEQNEYRYLYVNEKKQMWSIIGVKKENMFYRPSNSSTHTLFKKGALLDVLFTHSSKDGSWIFVKRNNESIKTVEIVDETGIYTIDVWDDEYAGIFIKSEKVIGKEVIAYDENKNIVDTREMW